MTQIDWNRAPVGATHYWRGEDCGVFLKKEGCTWFFVNDARWDNGKWKSSPELIDENYMIARHAGWNGSGLPPIGTVCELWIRDNEWAQCQVIAMDEQDGHPVSVVRYGAGYYAGTNKCLRPIKTAAQLAAEEREKAIDGIVNDYTYTVGPCTHKLARSQAERIFDAGYRKIMADAEEVKS